MKSHRYYINIKITQLAGFFRLIWKISLEASDLIK